MGRLSTYRKPNPVFKKLTKLLFALFQADHHDKKWMECPKSFSDRIKSVFQNIRLPSTCDSLLEEVDTLTEEYLENVKCIAQKRIYKGLSDIVDKLDQMNLKTFTNASILEALTVLKKWVRKAYRSVNVDSMTLVCDYILILTENNLDLVFKDNKFVLRNNHKKEMEHLQKATSNSAAGSEPLNSQTDSKKVETYNSEIHCCSTPKSVSPHSNKRKDFLPKVNNHSQNNSSMSDASCQVADSCFASPTRSNSFTDFTYGENSDSGHYSSDLSNINNSSLQDNSVK